MQLKENFKTTLLLIVCCGILLGNSACRSVKVKPTSTTSATQSKEKSAESTKKSVGPIMTFDEKSVDFGNVKKGDKKNHVFNFTNTGDETLEIDIVSACECTTLDWTTLPVKPGEKGKIVANFDSSEKTKGETIIITIILKNKEPKMGYPMVEEVKFKFEIIN